MRFMELKECRLLRVSTRAQMAKLSPESHLHAMLFLIKLSPRTEPAIVRAAFIDYQPIYLSMFCIMDSP